MIGEYLCGSPSNMCESSSNPETIDLGRVSQLGHDFSREEKNMKFCPRFSTSDIPNSVLRNVNFQSQIPKPIYSAENDLSQNDFVTKSEPTMNPITSRNKTPEWENLANGLRNQSKIKTPFQWFSF
ncbi:unnamed protein product [Brassica oleracea]